MTGDSVRLNSGNVVRVEEVAMPEAVREFLEAFNTGAYPDLELPPEKT